MLPWQKPWQGVEPANFITKRPYRGINPWVLSLSGYSCPYWVSFKQANQLGGRVKADEKGTAVVYWNWVEKEDDEGNKKKIPFLRYFTVYNLEQCEGIEWEIEKKGKKIPKIKNCEGIIKNMPKCPKIEHGKTAAYYRPSADSIGMPNRKNFVSSEEYYSTLFHELTHSTGHKSRTNRMALEGNVYHAFGSKDYSKEELVAEFGAAFLCAKTGIENKTINNSAAYLKSWLKRLKENKKWLVQAAAQAQKATDFILDIHHDED